eukprot:scaffold6334_cov139-Skeletonema_menzelii.AAC.6
MKFYSSKPSCREYSYSWISAICLAVFATQVCTAFKSSLSSSSSSSRDIFLFSSNDPKESDVIASVNTNNVSTNDPITDILPKLYTYQKPRQKRTPQTTLTRPRKPRFFWHDEQNIKEELLSFWDELNVPIHPDQPPPIPSEFLLNHFNRNDLRWGIAQFGGRENLSHALNGALIIPGKWKEAKELVMMQPLLHLIDNDRGDSKRSTRRNSETRANSINSNNHTQPLVAMVVESSMSNNTALQQPRKKECWSKEKAIRDLYGYLDNYKNYKSRPSVWMPQLSELKHEGYSKLFNACSRFKKLPHGAMFEDLHSQRSLDGNGSIEHMAGLVPYKEWRFFESQLHLFVELRHYLNLHYNGSQDTFPHPVDVELNGHEELAALIRSHGGKQLLAQKLDMDLVSTISIQSWGAFSLDFSIDLLQFIRERYVTMAPPLVYPVISMPSERDLKRHGREDLCNKVESFGGYENVARRLGLQFFDVSKQEQLDEQMIRVAKKLWIKRNEG